LGYDILFGREKATFHRNVLDYMREKACLPEMLVPTLPKCMASYYRRS